MDYEQLTTELTFSNDMSNMCVNLTTIFNAGANATPFNVNLTTMEPRTAVTLSPPTTTIDILDGRQFSPIFQDLRIYQIGEN